MPKKDREIPTAIIVARWSAAAASAAAVGSFLNTMWTSKPWWVKDDVVSAPSPMESAASNITGAATNQPITEASRPAPTVRDMDNLEAASHWSRGAVGNVNKNISKSVSKDVGEDADIAVDVGGDMVASADAPMASAPPMSSDGEIMSSMSADGMDYSVESIQAMATGAGPDPSLYEKVLEYIHNHTTTVGIIVLCGCIVTVSLIMEYRLRYKKQSTD